MGKHKIQFLRPDLEIRTDEAIAFYNELKQYSTLKIPDEYAILNTNRILRTYESIFLSIYLIWEDFLENAFLRYLCAATTDSGYSPTKIFPKQKNLNIAYKLLCVGRRYVDWANPDEVARIASIFFEDGEPFAPVINGSKELLIELRIIRNRIAHRSEFSREQFNKLLRSRLTYVPGSISTALALNPGRFLDTPIGPRAKKTYMEEYGEKVKKLGALIIPN